MSLAHHIFSLPQDQQDEAIRVLARKAIAAGYGRRSFENIYLRPIIHAKHAGGSSSSECSELQRRWRKLFSELSHAHKPLPGSRGGESEQRSRKHGKD